MKNPLKNVSLSVLLLLNRLAIGWYFAAAGWNKVQGELSSGLGSFYRSDSFQGRNPDWLPSFLAIPYGYALPWVELGFGALLMVGLFGRVSAGVLTLVSLSIAIALLGAGELLPSHHVMVFVALAFMLCALGPGRYSIDGAISRSEKP